MAENTVYQILVLNVTVTSLMAHIAFKRKPRTHSNEFICISMIRRVFLEQFAAELYVFHLVRIPHQALSAVQQHSMAESRQDRQQASNETAAWH